MFDVGVCESPLRCRSLYGRSDFVGCSADGDVEQLFERPCRLVYRNTKGCLSK